MGTAAGQNQAPTSSIGGRGSEKRPEKVIRIALAVDVGIFLDIF